MRNLEAAWRLHLQWAQEYLQAAGEANASITVYHALGDAVRNLEAARALIKSGASPADLTTSKHQGGPVADFLIEPDREALQMGDD